MYIAFALMCLIFGTTFMAIKIGVDAGIAPFFFAGTRFLAAGIIVGLSMYFKGVSLRLTKAEVGDTIFVGATMTTALFAAYYWGEQYVASGLAALLSATCPVMIAVIQQVRDGHKMGDWQRIGLMLGLAGVALAIGPSMIPEDNLLTSGAIGIMLVGQLCCAIGAVRAQKALQRSANIFVFNAYQMFFGGIGLVLLSLFMETNQTVLVNQTILFAWLYLTIFGSIVGHGIFYWLVKKSGPVFSATWTYVSPIIAQGVGYLWLDERITLLSFMGLILVLMGVLLQSPQLAKQLWRQVLCFLTEKSKVFHT